LGGSFVYSLGTCEEQLAKWQGSPNDKYKQLVGTIHDKN